MLSCSIWFSAPSFWMGGGLESRCVGRVWSADGVRHHPHLRNHMLQLIIECSWWWAYVPEISRAKNTWIKLPCFIKLTFHIISWWRCTVKKNLKYFFNILLTVHPCIIFFKWSQLGSHYFLVYLFQILYIFRAPMCPLSEELTVSKLHWYFSFCMGGCMGRRPDSHPYRTKNTSVV